MSVDEVIRANHALQGMIDKRDQQLAELRAELAELAAYNKRLERDREVSGIVIVP
jgi:phage shock protein A